MSNYFVPGPAHVAVGLGANKTMVYAGLSERGMSLNETMFEKNIVADIGGTVGMPADRLIAGKLVTLTGQMIWRNPSALLGMRGRIFGGAAGVIQSGEIGALILQEGLWFPVMVLSQYPLTKSVYSSEVGGVNLLYGYCSQNQQLNLGTSEQIFNVQFTGLYSPNYATGVWQGWNTNMAGFPAIA